MEFTRKRKVNEMKYSKSVTISSVGNSDELKEEDTYGYEIDILGLVTIIILGIVGYQFAIHGIAIPLFIWYLIGALIVIYIVLILIGILMFIHILKD